MMKFFKELKVKEDRKELAGYRMNMEIAKEQRAKELISEETFDRIMKYNGTLAIEVEKRIKEKLGE